MSTEYNLFANRHNSFPQFNLSNNDWENWITQACRENLSSSPADTNPATYIRVANVSAKDPRAFADMLMANNVQHNWTFSEWSDFRSRDTLYYTQTNVTLDHRNTVRPNTLVLCPYCDPFAPDHLGNPIPIHQHFYSTANSEFSHHMGDVHGVGKEGAFANPFIGFLAVGDGEGHLQTTKGIRIVCPYEIRGTRAPCLFTTKVNTHSSQGHGLKDYFRHVYKYHNRGPAVIMPPLRNTLKQKNNEVFIPLNTTSFNETFMLLCNRVQSNTPHIFNHYVHSSIDNIIKEQLGERPFGIVEQPVDDEEPQTRSEEQKYSTPPESPIVPSIPIRDQAQVLIHQPRLQDQKKINQGHVYDAETLITPPITPFDCLMGSLGDTSQEQSDQDFVVFSEEQALELIGGDEEGRFDSSDFIALKEGEYLLDPLAHDLFSEYLED